ncbi:MAG: sigma-70 family RNA polymerase sigma factor [Clostridia bacterium]|nr:sigma-70 family RNA polymerase sigma factor [Clostridia bacterium]
MDNTGVVEENALVASAKSGDDEAFRLLADKYNGFLTGYIQSLSVPPSERDDIMQEALVGLLRAVRTYDGVSSRFATYVAACVRNSVYSCLRKYGKQWQEVVSEDVQALVPSAEYITPEHQLLDIESTNQLYDRVFSALSEFEGAVFEMYLAEIPYAIIAKRLNKNEKSIDNAIQRIKAKLKKLV